MDKQNKFITSLAYAAASKETVSGFKKLYGAKRANEEIINFYYKKLKLSAIVIIIGILIYIIYPYIKTPVLAGPYEITRNDYGGGSRTVGIGYNVLNGENKNLELTVNERKYTDEQLENMYIPFEQALEAEILNNNISFDKVTTDLKFPGNIKNYPFNITYKTDKPAILSYSGKIDHSKLNENSGELVTIIATIKYDDFRHDEYIPAAIFAREKNEEEVFSENFENELKNSDEASKHMSYLSLPDEIDGIKINYFEKGEKTRLLIPVIAFIFAVALFTGNNDDLRKEIKNRDVEMEREYPKLINKFAVFYNAGMPVNAIWNKLCSEYEKTYEKTGKRNYTYEEMLITKMMIADGKNEIEAYEDFAKRCGLQQYKVFVSLLQQAITKGKGDMGNLLKAEAEEVFEKRKNDAKKLSEEASSKLLLPMFMMLIVVMIMIMFPAFKSFS